MVLSHLGYGEDLKLARRLVGVQVIVGGHSHTLLGSFPHKELAPAGPYPTVVKNPEGKDVLVVQAWEWGKVVGLLEVTFDAKGGAPCLQGRAHPHDPRGFPRGLLRQGGPSGLRPAGHGPDGAGDRPGQGGPHRRKGHRAQAGEQPGQPHRRRYGLEDPECRGADRPAKTAGGIRTTIPKGPITVGKVYEVLPFGNTLVVMDLKGREIKAALENGVSQWEQAAGRFLQVSGLRYAFDLSRAPGDRVVRVEVKTEKGYVPLDLEATYRVVVNNFIANGGRRLHRAQGGPRIPGGYRLQRCGKLHGLPQGAQGGGGGPRGADRSPQRTQRGKNPPTGPTGFPSGWGV